MKDSFLGLASHELKTPLTIILGYTELISGEMEDQLDQSTMEMVQNIRQAALRLDNIVRDMVDVTMIDEKRLQLRQDSISLNKLVETTANEFRIFFTKRSLQLVLNLDQSIPSITGDYLRLTQLLSNVLVNAIKFTPDGGRITISSIAKYLPHHLGDEKKSRVVFDQHPEQLFIDITVSDTGIGIDLDDQVRIFDKFYESGRIEEHSTGQVSFLAKGAGLGLAIAKGIAQIHGGEIWVESAGCNEERCPGSTFHILLPVDPPKGDKTLDYLSLVR
jgi:signal transduction histidine kinase